MSLRNHRIIQNVNVESPILKQNYQIDTNFLNFFVFLVKCGKVLADFCCLT